MKENEKSQQFQHTSHWLVVEATNFASHDSLDSSEIVFISFNFSLLATSLKKKARQSVRRAETQKTQKSSILGGKLTDFPQWP